MQLGLHLSGMDLLALMDSRSTHNFLAEDAAARTKMQLRHDNGIEVTLANGESVSCLGVYRATPLAIDNKDFSAYFALPLAGYDVVLGTLWLATLGPIL